MLLRASLNFLNFRVPTIPFQELVHFAKNETCCVVTDYVGRQSDLYVRNFVYRGNK